MNLEIEGKLIIILPEQTGEGKNGKWVKQDFVLEIEDKFPKKVCFSSWGDKADELKKLKIGEKLKVSFNAESREFNQKWYTDLRIWKIEKLSGGSTTSGTNSPPPFTVDDIPPVDEEDLPF